MFCNLSNICIYVDLTKSFLIKNGIAIDYFLNRVTHSYDVDVVEKPIIAIPPCSAKILGEYKIMNQHFVDCDLYEQPGKNEVSSITFNKLNTPVNFTNYICYRVGDNGADRIIENDFFVSEITNKNHERLFMTVQSCESDRYRTLKEVFIKTSPKEFYIEYVPREQIKSKTNVVNLKANEYFKNAQDKNSVNSLQDEIRSMGFDGINEE